MPSKAREPMAMICLRRRRRSSRSSRALLPVSDRRPLVAVPVNAFDGVGEGRKKRIGHFITVGSMSLRPPKLCCSIARTLALQRGVCSMASKHSTAHSVFGWCLLSALLAGAGIAGAEPPLSRICEGRSAVDFCDQRLPLNTASVHCYKRNGSAPQTPALELTPLTCLTELTELSLVSGEIEFILTLKLGILKPLTRLQRLTRLAIEETTLDELEPLASLRGLQTLSVHRSPVKNLRPLAQLEQLRELDLSCTLVSDLVPLQSLKRLERLDLTNTPVRDLSALAGLSKLTWLGLSETSQVTPAQRLAIKQRLPGLTVSQGRRY